MTNLVFLRLNYVYLYTKDLQVARGPPVLGSGLSLAFNNYYKKTGVIFLSLEESNILDRLKFVL